MPRFLKTLLLSLLMLALPIQGFAAVVGLSCGPAHQQHGLMTFADAHEHGHKGHAHQATHDKGSQHIDAHDQHQDEPDAPQAFASTCSACAACCVGAVIPPSALHLTPPDHGIIADIPAPDTMSPGHIPDGLKRPPRSSLV